VRGRSDVEAWVAGYERAWRTAGTEPLHELFTSDATYQTSPYENPLVGLDEIAQMWEAEREGPEESFTMQSEVVALEENVAVIRVQVSYENASPSEYRDLWVIRFAADGRCAAFEEWPFWPGQLRAPDRSQ
jgi:ketosteroid isomerase-like protein